MKNKKKKREKKILHSQHFSQQKSNIQKFSQQLS